MQFSGLAPFRHFEPGSTVTAQHGNTEAGTAIWPGDVYVTAYQEHRRFSGSRHTAAAIERVRRAVVGAVLNGRLPGGTRLTRTGSGSSIVAVIDQPNRPQLVWRSTEDLLICTDGVLRTTTAGEQLPTPVQALQCTGHGALATISRWIARCIAAGVLPADVTLGDPTVLNGHAAAVLSAPTGRAIVSQPDWLVISPTTRQYSHVQAMEDTAFRDHYRRAAIS